jgi:hypothetical protein
MIPHIATGMRTMENQLLRLDTFPPDVKTHAGANERNLQTKAGEVRLKVPKLRQQTFETAIIERYRRRESSALENVRNSARETQNETVQGIMDRGVTRVSNAPAAPSTKRGQSRHFARHKAHSNLHFESNRVGKLPPAVWQRHESEQQLVPSHDIAPKRRITTHLH